MSKIYQKSFFQVKTAVRREAVLNALLEGAACCLPESSVTHVIPVPAAQAILKGPAPVIPEATPHVIPKGALHVIPEGRSRESRRYETAERLSPPTKTFGGDGVCAERLGLTNPAGRQTAGNDRVCAKRPGLWAKTFGHNVKYLKRACAAGFTLIELLVVVLIIGILAAVALPQYQKAVARSRLAGLISLASSIAQAEQRYYMANGAYTIDAEDLDIALPGGFSGRVHDRNSSYSDGKVSVDLYEEGYGGAARVSVRYSGLPSFVLWGFDPKHYRYCGVDINESADSIKLGKSICATYGKPIHADGEAHGGYFYYSLN